MECCNITSKHVQNSINLITYLWSALDFFLDVCLCRLFSLTIFEIYWPFSFFALLQFVVMKSQWSLEVLVNQKFLLSSHLKVSLGTDPFYWSFFCALKDHQTEIITVSWYILPFAKMMCLKKAFCVSRLDLHNKYVCLSMPSEVELNTAELHEERWHESSAAFIPIILKFEATKNILWSFGPSLIKCRL